MSDHNHSHEHSPTCPGHPGHVWYSHLERRTDDVILPIEEQIEELLSHKERYTWDLIRKEQRPLVAEAAHHMNQFMLQTAQLAKTEELLGYDPRQSRAMLLQEQRQAIRATVEQVVVTTVKWIKQEHKNGNNVR